MGFCVYLGAAFLSFLFFFFFFFEWWDEISKPGRGVQGLLLTLCSAITSAVFGTMWDAEGRGAGTWVGPVEGKLRPLSISKRIKWAWGEHSNVSSVLQMIWMI